MAFSKTGDSTVINTVEIKTETIVEACDNSSIKVEEKVEIKTELLET